MERTDNAPPASLMIIGPVSYTHLDVYKRQVAADGQRTVNHTAAVPHQSEAQFHVELAAVLMHRPGCQHLVPVLGLAAVDGFVKAVPVRVSERSGMITSRLSPRTSLGA